MIEREVHFESEGLRLAGTLTLPGSMELHPAVLMIVGSGKVDRDENIPRLRIDALRQLAAYLGERGFGSLRFDKRGVGASEGDYWETGLHDNVVDAGAALPCLRSQPGVDPGRVFVLGHSEGAWIAIRLAAGGSEIAGTILLAATARAGEQCLHWQPGASRRECTASINGDRSAASRTRSGFANSSTTIPRRTSPASWFPPWRSSARRISRSIPKI